MKKYISLLLPVIVLLAVATGCKKSDSNQGPKILTHTVTVSWFRDSTTANPAAFLDLYHGVAYTSANAALKADSIDLFVYDNSALTISSTTLGVIDMVFFGNNNYAAYSSFNQVVGVVPFSNYNASTVSEVAITPADFNNINYNVDIASLFASKALNGGYTDITINSTDLTTLKYYQFVCAKTGKRGFFHVISSNYLPGGYMTLEIKVEQ